MSLLVIASVMALVWVAFREEIWLRRMLGLGAFSPRDRLAAGATDLNEVLSGAVARVGGSAEPTVTIDRSVHRTTWGVRVLSLSLTGLLIWFMVNPPERQGGMEVVGSMIPGGFYGGLAILALAVYSVIFTWAYRLEIDRDTLSVMGPAFAMRDYPLDGLERIEEDGAYGWRMRFADGRRPYVMKSVVGSAGLRQRLAEVLAADERG